MDDIRFEDPGQPQPAPQPRPKQPPDPVNLARQFLAGLPKGEEDWDDKRPRTQADVDLLRGELTLSQIPVKERRQMGPERLLQIFGDQFRTQLRDESQFHIMIYIALGSAAVGFGLRTSLVDKIGATHIGMSEASVGRMRLGVQQWITAIDILHKNGLRRAYELPIRRKNCIQSLRRLSHEVFTIFAGMTITEMEPKERYATFDGGLKLFIPQKELDSSPLHVPDLIHELSGGKLRYIFQRQKYIPAAEAGPIPNADPTNHNMMIVMERLGNSY